MEASDLDKADSKDSVVNVENVIAAERVRTFVRTYPFQCHLCERASDAQNYLDLNQYKIMEEKNKKDMK